jgi:hypothetical protein
MNSCRRCRPPLSSIVPLSIAVDLAAAAAAAV